VSSQAGRIRLGGSWFKVNHRQNSFQDLIPMEKSWVFWHVPAIPVIMGVHKIGESWSRSAWEKKQDFISKITRSQRVEGMVHMVDHLPHEQKGLNSNPIPPKIKSNKSFMTNS
jgi:hypothetical protein